MRSKIKIIPNKKGFTIVEALIVLAVTGMLFVSTSFLIRGQIEKVRYQDSMRQLQQLVQNTIDDVENGYFVGTVGNSSDVFAGKRITFCTDSSVVNDDGNWRQPCVTGSSQLRIENVAVNSTGDIKLDTEDPANNKEYYQTLPGGLKYTKFYKYDTAAYPPPDYLGPRNASSGVAIMFTNILNTDTRPQGLILFEPYLDNNNLSAPNGREDEWNQTNTPSYWNNGKVFCFEGYKKGSLVIGRNGSKNVDLNIEDPRCN